MDLNEYAVIVAGGKGTRIPSQVPKQFLELNGLPVLMHTINVFYRYSNKVKIIVVLPHDDIDTWNTLCRKHDFHIPVLLVDGGATRFQSVRAGLERIYSDGLVAIHDGVRPLVSGKIIAESYRLAAIHETAVASVAVKESVRQVENSTSKSMDRSKLRLIQTPQTFRVSRIKEAYAVQEDVAFTDDASVAEQLGMPITLFEGGYDNIKITTPEDLIIAEGLMNRRKEGAFKGKS